jgi:DNA helicase-2/ATP-dependent DNA helicase PcrA
VESPVPEEAVLRLSFGHIDDYHTCPLKYRYVHILRVPLLAHHRVIYGSAVHKAVQRFFQARLAGRELTAEQLIAAFRSAWVSEGFLSREHEERRLAAGEETLRRFWASADARALTPAAVEQEFCFFVGRNKVNGRYDLVVESAGRVSIVDFKTGAVDSAQKARERVKESLQLDIYALAYLRTGARLPDWVELRFLESGLAAGKAPTLDETDATERLIAEVAAAIRRREFPATPSYRACTQCAFREICPHTSQEALGAT